MYFIYITPRVLRIVNYGSIIISTAVSQLLYVYFFFNIQTDLIDLRQNPNWEVLN